MWDGEPSSAPLIIVEGFLCATSPIVWGDFATQIDIGTRQVRQQGDVGLERHDSSSDQGSRQSLQRTIVFAPVGPVSSIHDRACELFYALRGGRVDYGAQHAAAHGHRRFGRRYDTPLLPQWAARGRDGSVQGRAHFIGHSLGGLTIIKLYDLLAEGFFDEALGCKETSSCATSPCAAAILSILTISSPLRGTPLVYTLGLDPTASLPRLRLFSVGDCIAKFVHIATWVRRLPLAGWSQLQWVPDFHAEAWEFAGFADEGAEDDTGGVVSKSSVPTPSSWKRWYDLDTLFAQLRRSIWAEGTDCAPWDCTFAQRRLLEASGGIWSGQIGDHGKNGDDVAASQKHKFSDKVWLRSIAATMEDPKARIESSNARSWLPRRLSLSILQGPLGVFYGSLAHFDYSVLDVPWNTSEKAGSLEAGHVAADSGYASETDDQRSSTRASEKQTATSIGAKDVHRRLGASQESALRDWRANDGVVPLASQYHPGPCRSGYCTHTTTHQAFPPTSLPAWIKHALCALWPLKRAALTNSAAKKCNSSHANAKEYRAPSEDVASLPVPNVWHVTYAEQTSHVTLAPFWIGSQQQVAFWQDIGRWLVRVEQAATVDQDGHARI